MQSEKVLKFLKILVLKRATIFTFNRLFGKYLFAKGIKAASFFEILPTQRFAVGQNFKKDTCQPAGRQAIARSAVASLRCNLAGFAQINHVETRLESHLN
jgi:hypothetical protein